MRIGFDGKKAVSNLTGIGNYSRRVANALAARLGTDDELLLYVPSRMNVEAVSRLDGRVSLRAGHGSGWRYQLWRALRQWHAVKADGMDIYHGLSNELPWRVNDAGCRSVVTVHDLIFMRHPQWFSMTARTLLRWKVAYACRVANHIIAISECTRRDIIDLLGVEPSRVSVVYQSIDPCFAAVRPSPDDKLALRARLGIGADYVVAVGTIERRKNQVNIVKAMQAVPDNLSLVIAGRPTSYLREVMATAQSMGLGDRVKVLHNVAQQDLPLLYNGAVASVYLSRYEGFGLPVAEAQAAGAPVIAATGSCLEEAGGDAAIYVSPEAARDVAEAIAAIWGDTGRRDGMIARGRVNAARFNDNAMADGLLGVYNKVTG